MLVGLEGRSVDREQHLGAGLAQRLGDGGQPPILADHQPDAEAAEGDGAGHRAGIEDALFVEDAVVRQLVLGAARGDAPALEQEGGVVQPVTIRPGAAHDQPRPAIGGLGRELGDDIGAGGDIGRLAHKVLGQVAADREFRRHHQFGAEARTLGPRGADAFRIGAQRADMRGVDLGKRDLQRVGHDRRNLGMGGRRVNARRRGRYPCPPALRRASPWRSRNSRPTFTRAAPS